MAKEAPSYVKGRKDFDNDLKIPADFIRLSLDAKLIYTNISNLESIAVIFSLTKKNFEFHL